MKLINKLPWVLIVLLLILFARIQSCQTSRADKRLKEQQDSTKYWTDKYGNAHAELQEIILEKEQMKKQVDSISEVLKIKPKQVIKYIKADLIVNTVLVTDVDTVKITDTAGVGTIVYDIKYRDSTFLSLEGRVPSNPQKFKIGLNAQITYTEYWKRKKILGLKIGSKERFIDLGTNNPYVTLDNAKAYKLKPDRKLKVKTGIGIGVTVNPITGKILPGVQFGIFLTK